MFISKKKDYQKQYLPGYSGHVPRKNDLFGITAGDANKILVKKAGADKFFESGGHRPENWTKTQARHLSQGADLRGNHMKYTNWSKKAPSWICGPNHEIRVQHIPGYRGHVPGLKPENLHGKAFGRTTATAINSKKFNRVKGQRANSRETFLSMNRKEFSPDNFRRFLENPHIQGK